jgi:hypothetical protein
VLNGRRRWQPEGDLHGVLAGGDNLGDFGYPVQIPRATLTVDGTPFVKQGKLIMSAARAAR